MIPLMLLAAQIGTAAVTPLPSVPVADPVLAEQRGGFLLPNGIDVAMTVQTQTSVDGMVVLRTVFRADQGPASLSVYAPKVGTTVADTTTRPATTGATAASSSPTVSVDGRGFVQITPAPGTPGIAVAGGRHGDAALPAGLVAVDTGNGGIATGGGTLAEQTRGAVRAVELHGSDLSVTHLTGGAFGSVITNAGSDRVIDTQTSVSIDLVHAGPDVLGSAMFRVQDLAIDAVGMRAQ